MFLLLYRDRLIPARQVEVTPALGIATHAPPAGTAPPSPAAAPADGRLLFQASGWVEPDPLAVKATALTDGFIDQVHVLEGAAVKQGDLLATLIDADAKLTLDAATAEVTMLEADLAALGNSANSTRHKLQAEQASLVAAQADATEAADRLHRLEKTSSGAVPETERITAKLEDSRRQAGVRIRQALIEQAEEDLKGISHETAAMSARIAAAIAKQAQAKLDLDRTRIKAPITGRVQRLLAAPGQKKMAIMDDVDSSTVAILYDPAKVQVRVDVPLADAAGLSVGQTVRIRCNLLPDRPFTGVVTRLNGEADLQRNTLQAKVRILDPADQLRPEMLCRAEFLEMPAAAAAAAPAATSGTIGVFVPESSIRDAAVWICDPETSRVAKRPIVTTPETRDGYRRLDSGVRPGEWVVRNPADLRDGQRVHPTQTP